MLLIYLSISVLCFIVFLFMPSISFDERITLNIKNIHKQDILASFIISFAPIINVVMTFFAIVAVIKSVFEVKSNKKEDSYAEE